MVSLSKADQVVARVQSEAPHLVSLAKTAGVSLKKYELDGITARVVLVLDASGSMWWQFQNGNMQKVLDRIATLALNFDDDAELELWAFGTYPAKYENVRLNNLSNYVARVLGQTELYRLGGDNQEPALMQQVLESLDFHSRIPTYIVFITDGGIFLSDQIADILRKASRYPAFWQYVGIGGSSYGILENFDTLKYRYVDNAGFFALDDLNRVSDQDLYDRLLKEFPQWLKTLQVQQMLAGV